jgi:mono/diheme cytochrome c family protein
MRYIAACVSVFLLVGCDGSPSVKAPADADLQRGKQLYERDCLLCHGADGRGGSLAAALGGVPDLAAGQLGSLDDVAAVILNGQGRMQGWAGMLDEDEVLDIASYLKRPSNAGD